MTRTLARLGDPLREDEGRRIAKCWIKGLCQIPAPATVCLPSVHPALVCIPPAMGSSPLIEPAVSCLGDSGLHMVSPVLSSTFSAALGLLTIRGFPPVSPILRLGLNSSAERPRQQLSHVCSYACSPDLMPVPADLAVRGGLAAPSRRPRSRKASCPLMRSNGDLVGLGEQELGWGVASRVGIGALLPGCSQAGLSSSLPVSFSEPLPTGLFSSQLHR